MSETDQPRNLKHGGFVVFYLFENEEHFRLFTIPQSTEIGGWEKFKLRRTLYVGTNKRSLDITLDIQYILYPHGSG